MKRLCLIGGVSANGKSETVRRLCEDPDFVFYKFHHLLKREFAFRGIALRDALQHWQEVVPEVAARYVREMPENICALSDIHYAVQPEYDLRVAAKEIIGEGMPTAEPYSCGVDKSLIERLMEGNVDVMAVLLTAPTGEILQRRGVRLKERGMTRSFDFKSIQQEQVAEENFYHEVCSQLGLAEGHRLILDNSEKYYDHNVTFLSKALKTGEDTF